MAGSSRITEVLFESSFDNYLCPSLDEDGIDVDTKAVSK